ncbi:LuxR family transcriptional regulator [Agaricicola taiwanensis]|uniref:LuxR family transcriptional regulator n=1 Tax=Agaricicola taiwanensis TaxID=591372 RepID=A0A8J3DW57_9RHOB|nr:TatD family hydrolase [Agaricicola taiwanensis]GGE45712.1 LuxR family transcriptional regulator [Agaricicola taiwanensis]
MKPLLVDSHCHLDYEGLSEDRPGVIERARAAGVGLMVTISTRVRQFDRIRAIIEAHDNVFGSVGTHPHNAHEELDITTEELIRLAQHPKVVAIGEAGLDYHYDNSPRDAQAQGFRAHIAAARETGLPLVIHARSADEDMIRILEEESARGSFPAVLHCFSSGAELARRGVALGLYVSFSGIITFKNSAEIRAIAAEVPEDRLLVETDAPFLAPVPYRGRSNEPSYVIETAKVLAGVRGWSEEEVAERTTDNFFRLFSKVPRTALATSEAA